jgi:hypothetical protein
MVEFKGKISKECKKYILLRKAKQDTWIISIAGLFVVLIVLPIYLSIFDLSSSLVLFIIIDSCLVWAACACIAFFSAQGNVTQEEYIPLRVVISETGAITQYTKRSEHISSVAEVKKVIDHGDWFVLICPSPTGVGHREIICQKDLLLQGTVEDFKKLFEGKIIRK